MTGRRSSPRVPAVDVVIPVHDGAAHIGACVSALARQTVRPARVIVVDDESTDGGAELAIAALRGAGLPSVLISLERRSGPGAARNRGLAATTAPLIWFVDADDTVADNALELLLDALGDNDFAVCRATFVSADGRVLGIDEPPPPASQVSGHEFVHLLIAGTMRAYPTTKLFRRGVLGDRPWDEVRRYEDMAAMVGLALRARAVALIADAPYHYRRHAVSASNTFDVATLELLAMPSRVRSRATDAGYRVSRADLAAFALRESVFPVAHLAMRSGGGPLAHLAIQLARARIAVRELVIVAACGQLRLAAAAVVLKTCPGVYARVLRRR